MRSNLSSFITRNQAEATECVSDVHGEREIKQKGEELGGAHYYVLSPIVLHQT